MKPFHAAIRPFFIGSSAIILGSLFMLSAHAATTSDLQDAINQKQQEIERIEQEIGRFQDTLDKTAAEANTLANEITAANARIGKIAADISLTDTQISKTQLTIEELAVAIRTTEDTMRDRRNALAELLRTMHELEGESLVEVLLAKNQLSDFFGEVEYLTNLDGALRERLDALRITKDTLDADRRATEAQQRRLANLRSDYTAQRTIQESVKSEKNTLLKSTREEETEYQRLIREREEVRREILTEIASIEDELRLLIDPSTLPKKREGVLAYPIERPFVTQGFGLTEFAKNRTDVYAGGGHNGIDFRASVGAPILAADGGIVRASGNSDLSCPGGSYGKWILVEHQNNLATLYAHLSLISVQNGQEVGRGERIGYSGNTGYTTGPHLHFTVYDARTVRFGPSRSGRCDYLPFGGYIDPLNYL